MIAFLDTHVLVDALVQREPFFQDSFAVWSLVDQSQIQGFISAISFNNIAYIVRKTEPPQKINRGLRMLRDSFQIVPLDQQILNQAIDSDFKDFEGAIQFFSALRVSARTLISRNVSHFPSGDLAIQTPSQFLAAHFPKQDRL